MSEKEMTLKDRFKIGIESCFYIGLFLFWICGATEWFGNAIWNEIFLNPFYLIFNIIFWFDHRYVGIQPNSLALGYWAMFFFLMAIMGLLSKYSLEAKNIFDIPKAVIKTAGIISINVIIFELGVFITQPWSCSGDRLYPYIEINIFQWMQSNFATPASSLHCYWTMNFPVSVWSWEFFTLRWLENWSFSLIAGCLFTIYLALRHFGKI